MSLISLLIVVLVACVLIWAAGRLIVAFQIPEPIGTVMYVVIVVVAMLWLLGYVPLGTRVGP